MIWKLLSLLNICCFEFYFDVVGLSIVASEINVILAFLNILFYFHKLLPLKKKKKNLTTLSIDHDFIKYGMERVYACMHVLITLLIKVDVCIWK